MQMSHIASYNDFRRHALCDMRSSSVTRAWRIWNWDRAEDISVEAMVATEIESNPFSKRRGIRDIWEAGRSGF